MSIFGIIIIENGDGAIFHPPERSEGRTYRQAEPVYSSSPRKGVTGSAVGCPGAFRRRVLPDRPPARCAVFARRHLRWPLMQGSSPRRAAPPVAAFQTLSKRVWPQGISQNGTQIPSNPRHLNSGTPRTSFAVPHCQFNHTGGVLSWQSTIAP